MRAAKRKWDRRAKRFLALGGKETPEGRRYVMKWKRILKLEAAL